MNYSSLFIIGCGDIGMRVGAAIAAMSIKVFGFSRGNKFPHDTTSSGITLSHYDLDILESSPAPDFKGAPLLYLAPPPGGGKSDTRVANFLVTIKPGFEPAKVIYMSTTSVYGECGDDTITEERAVNPSNHTALRRYDAEQRFRLWCSEHSVPLVILRVSGIYGPGRIPMQRIHSREPLLNEIEAGYTNRIHSDDLTQICIAAIEKGEDGDIFNISDGETNKMNDYFNAITDLMGVDRLPQVTLEEGRKVMSPLMLSYMTESRKVSNRRMLDRLGITLKYPTMLEGLKVSL
ncbi:MAG: NAD-dependent epimerase/dehydratase family protein [Geobacteraceae bacterium]|nr:NAD-dependent epimerase/dehydratase family protein [Geobacteraceae bacterium]